MKVGVVELSCKVVVLSRRRVRTRVQMWLFYLQNVQLQIISSTRCAQLHRGGRGSFKRVHSVHVNENELINTFADLILSLTYSYTTLFSKKTPKKVGNS